MDVQWLIISIIVFCLLWFYSCCSLVTHIFGASVLLFLLYMFLTCIQFHFVSWTETQTHASVIKNSFCRIANLFKLNDKTYLWKMVMPAIYALNLDQEIDLMIFLIRLLVIQSLLIILGMELEKPFHAYLIHVEIWLYLHMLNSNINIRWHHEKLSILTEKRKRN